MESKLKKQMAIMTDAVQPHCDEKIVAALTCSHAGTMSKTLLSKLVGEIFTPGKSFNLPNPVFIAVGTDNVFAFNYKPRMFKFKIKKEAARWSKNEIDIKFEDTGKMIYFVMKTSSGEAYSFEVPVVFGGRELVQIFLKELTE